MHRHVQVTPDTSPRLALPAFTYLLLTIIDYLIYIALYAAIHKYLKKFQIALNDHRSPLTKLTLGQNLHIFANFLEANFEYFRPSTVREDKNN